jgi:hypothetical protein
MSRKVRKTGIPRSAGIQGDAIPERNPVRQQPDRRSPRGHTGGVDEERSRRKTSKSNRAEHGHHRSVDGEGLDVPIPWLRVPSGKVVPDPLAVGYGPPLKRSRVGPTATDERVAVGSVGPETIDTIADVRVGLIVPSGGASDPCTVTIIPPETDNLAGSGMRSILPIGVPPGASRTSGLLPGRRRKGPCTR